MAAAVFSDYGYSAARIADMVRMAGISHGNYARRRHLFRVMREAETLGSMMEHLAYVQIGLPAELPRPETIDALGRVTGESWYLILTARSRLG